MNTSLRDLARLSLALPQSGDPACVWGQVLIAVGVALIILAALGSIRTVRAWLEGANVWDFLIKLLDKAPWVVAVGCFLIVVGAWLVRPC